MIIKGNRWRLLVLCCLSLPVQRLKRAAQTADSRQHTDGYAHAYDPSAQLKLTAQPDR